MRKTIFYLFTFVLGIAVGASLVWFTFPRNIPEPAGPEVSQLANTNPVEPTPRFVGIGHIWERMNLTEFYRTNDYRIISVSGPAFRSNKEARRAIRELLSNAGTIQYAKGLRSGDQYLVEEKLG